MGGTNQKDSVVPKGKRNIQRKYSQKTSCQTNNSNGSMRHDRCKVKYLAHHITHASQFPPILSFIHVQMRIML